MRGAEDTLSYGNANNSETVRMRNPPLSKKKGIGQPEFPPKFPIAVPCSTVQCEMGGQSLMFISLRSPCLPT